MVKPNEPEGVVEAEIETPCRLSVLREFLTKTAATLPEVELNPELQAFVNKVMEEDCEEIEWPCTPERAAVLTSLLTKAQPELELEGLQIYLVLLCESPDEIARKILVDFEEGKFMGLSGNEPEDTEAIAKFKRLKEAKKKKT